MYSLFREFASIVSYCAQAVGSTCAVALRAGYYSVPPAKNALRAA